MTPVIQLKTEIPGPNSRALMELRRAEVARGPFHTTPVFIERGQGAVIEDVDGNRLIDFAAGIGVVNVGQAAPEVVRAIQEQAGRFTHASINVTPYEGYVRLCEKLNRKAPGTFAKKSFLANSGAEAVENAIKFARAYTRRQAVVCFDHGFHGRTYMAMSLTSKAKPYKMGFGPFNPEVYRAPFPYGYRWPDPARVSEECFRQFQELVVSNISPDNVAAVIIEPVLGEGGFVPAPREFLAKLREFCTTHGIVLIADEIQTAFGRTGTLFASEQLGLEPDVITMAKGLGGGMPISAVTGRAEILDAPIEGAVGGTYGGNPVACAAALAVFDLFEDGTLLERALATGERLRRALLDWKDRYELVGDVRGLGPMQAIELVRNRSTKEPFSEAAKQVVRWSYERGVVVMSSGTHGNVMRFLVPLVIEQGQLEEGLAVVESGLSEIRP